MDEPAIRSPSTTAASETPLGEVLQRLFSEQHYAVLCVHGDGQPYGALVAYAYADDLRTLYFGTPTATRKYRLVSECAQVALVVDTRETKRTLMETEAVTATGRATQLEGNARDAAIALLNQRHPQLVGFHRGPSTAIFAIDVVRYLHVVRFQDVRQWQP